LELKNKIRFAWWAAEELGLLGSDYYVTDLKNNNQDEFKKIACNLNFDMLGKHSDKVRTKCNAVQDRRTFSAAYSTALLAIRRLPLARERFNSSGNNTSETTKSRIV